MAIGGAMEREHRHYCAFISYSHKDEAVVDKLFRRLDGYKIPKELLDKETEFGPVPSKLYPIFRDREELDSRGELSTRIQSALATSDHLIIVCTPNAAASKWVNEEINYFAQLGRADRIHAVLAEGEPNSAFPPALTAAIGEPIAADLRASGDGWSNGPLKLIAGVLGISFGELQDRERIRAKKQLRRYQGIAAAMAVLALVAVVGGVMAWRYAKESEQRLEQAVGIAGGIGHEAIEMGDRFGVPLSAIERLLTRADAAFKALIETGGNTTAIRAQYAILQMVYAASYSVTGNADSRLQAAEKAHGSFVKLVAEQPSNREWRQYLAMSQDLIGDALLAMGQTNRADEAFKQALAIRQALADEKPQDDRRQRDLAISLSKRGEALTKTQQWDAAFEDYQNALAVNERLVANQLRYAEAQRDLLQAKSRFGDALVQKGDYTSAETAYRASLEIAERLAANDPTNRQLQLDLAAAHEKVGQALEKQDRLDDALASARTSMSIAKRLAEDDSSNVILLQNLLQSHAVVGSILLKQSDQEAALGEYQASLNIAERLTARDPVNSQWQRQLSISHNTVGDALLQRGDLDAALAHYQQSLQIRQQLSKKDPVDLRAQRDLSFAHDRIGRVLVRKKHFDAALVEYKCSLDIAQKLASADPTNLQFQRELAMSHQIIGDVGAKNGDPNLAVEAYRSALGIREQLAANSPEDPQRRRELLQSYDRLIGAEEQFGKSADTHELYCRFKQVIESRPANESANAEWLDRLSIMERSATEKGASACHS